MSERPISLAELELLEAERWSEAVFTQKVRTEAIAAGWLFYHTADSRGSDRGFPDCVMVRGERIVFAELKVPGGRIEREQEAWLAQLREAAQPSKNPYAVNIPEVYTWWPKDWPEIKELLS